jgi:predicted pyridoxine 5'-phosphate oxidase superfamily flavin-nucleotide-binding protein
MNTSDVDWDDCCCEGPFHEGECEVQKRVGEEHIAKRTGQIISDGIPGRAIQFVNNQPLVITSSIDKDKNIWTSILVGNPGFVTALDEQNVQINLSKIVSSKLDLFWENIRENTNVGMLFIELTTRKRLRVNGMVSVSDKNINVSVEQAYPNCPKYIQRREIEVVETDADLSNSNLSGSSLTNDLKEWIGNSDTMFVGSSDDKSNLDASHRGGDPGFIQIVDESTLKIPDYPGNSMYNTLGNFMSNPKAGLLFVDFKEGKTLQLTGKAEIVWHEEDAQEKTGGTMRLWEFVISKWIQIDSLKSVNWRFIDSSPFNP